jgi:hypothetical protein
MVESTGSDIVSRLPSVARSNDAGDSKTCPHALHSELTRESTVPEAVALDNGIWDFTGQAAGSH